MCIIIISIKKTQQLQTRVLNNREAKYWVGQKFCVSFSIQFYGKIQMNILANPIHQTKLTEVKGDIENGYTSSLQYSTFNRLNNKQKLKKKIEDLKNAIHQLE